MSTITKSQIKKLRTVASKGFGSCDCRRPTGTTPGYVCDYHRWLGEQFDVASTRELTFAQAGRAIDLLQGKRPKKTTQNGAEPWRGTYPVPGAKGRVSQAQADEIARLELRLGWAESPDRLQGMIRRQLGRPASVSTPVANLANRQASSLITGMKRLLKSNRENA